MNRGRPLRSKNSSKLKLYYKVQPWSSKLTVQLNSEGTQSSNQLLPQISHLGLSTMPPRSRTSSTSFSPPPAKRTRLATTASAGEGFSLPLSPQNEDSGEEPTTEEDDDDLASNYTRRSGASSAAATVGSAGSRIAALEEGEGSSTMPRYPLSRNSGTSTGSASSARVPGPSHLLSVPAPNLRAGGSASRATQVNGGGEVLDLTEDDDDDEEEEIPLEVTQSRSNSDLAFSSAKLSANSKGKTRAVSTWTNPPPPRTAAPSSGAALSALTCPICFGSPSPLAITVCGHAFCAGCLHSALLAGPALSPQPAGANGMGVAGYVNRARVNATLFGPGSGGRGVAGASARRGGNDSEEETELDKHCPVCRTRLTGGWGKSLRGLTLRMVAVKGSAAKVKDED